LAGVAKKFTGHRADALLRRSDAIANAIGYAKHRSPSHNALIRVYDAAGNVIETHEHKGDQSLEDILAKIR
jgi:hypothetical protein